jgi:hypothetical protein
MKLKLCLAAAVLISAFAAVEARAGCHLEVRPGSFIARGFSYYYELTIWDGFGPPPLPGTVQWTVKFYGAKDGIPDIPNGEDYPGTYDFGVHNLTGFENPLSGGLTGQYIRWAVITDQFGNTCATNPVEVQLQ